jgi:hypothetical protein
MATVWRKVRLGVTPLRAVHPEKEHAHMPYQDTGPATEAYAQAMAERAIADPVKLRRAARIFRAARARGLVDADGNVIGRERGNGSTEDAELAEGA